MDEVCLLIKEWRIKYLHFGKDFFNLDVNRSLTILKEIQEVRFPNLQWIYLRDNLIESVEGLNQIHLPQLERLYLSTYANI